MTLPLTRTCPHAPNPEYLRLQEEEPVYRAMTPSGVEAWVLTRHEDIRIMLSDPRFSADRTKPGFPSLFAMPQVKAGSVRSLLFMDPPEHGPARRAVLGEFTVKRVAELRPRIHRIVHEHIDAMLAGPRPADLVRALALPVPSLVVCELLGVPFADHEFFTERATTLLKRDTPPEGRGQAIGDLRSYLDELVAGKEADPPDDLFGRQIRKQREAGGKADREALVSLGFLLLLAGHETTTNMISLGVFGLLRHPAQLAVIRADPAKTPGAVEELLRYYSIIDAGISRLALDDIEIGGVRIKAGEGVVGLPHVADHDPEVFPDPLRFDVERGARHHLAFGFGAHQCLGHNLARAELQIVFDALFARIPDLRLAVSEDQVPFKSDANVYGIYELPVTW
ncbi:cytochrome P450 [Amycolatopsis pigmentata]|uniref:Cytochrome P450 n=1 Tax=Amycolatopsis pigmentata TaxID=450801 RepID=A0ABW5FYM1_9PSEU